VTDHRAGITKYGIEQMMAGEMLEEIVEGLYLHYRADELEAWADGQ
jgi:protein subunit release factor A